MKKRGQLDDMQRARTATLQRRQELLAKKVVIRPPPIAAASAPRIESTAPSLTQKDGKDEKAAFRKTRFAAARIPLLLGGGSTHRVPGVGLTALTNELLDAADTRDFRTLLVWPGTPSSPALAHCTATIHRWSVGDKWGIRTLWYPVVASTAYGIRPLALERKAFLTLTSELAESASGDNRLPARPLPAKDSLFFSVANADGETSPTLGEVIPQFFSTQGIAEWKSFEKRYVRNASRTLSASHKKAIRDTAAKLGTPDTAPDAWFGIGLRETSAGIEDALKMLRSARMELDVVIVCATRKVRQQPEWKKKLELFLTEIHRRFPDRTPGVIVLCDEPVSHATSVKHVLSNVRRKTGWPKDVRKRATLWPHDGWDLRSQDWKPGKSPEPKNPHVRVVDSASGRAVEAVDRLLRSADLPEELVDQLEDLQLFFTQLSNMCARRAELESWIEASASRERVTATDHWLSHKSRLAAVIESGALAVHRSALEDLKATGDRLWQASSEGLPLVRVVEEFINANANRTTPSMLLFGDERERELARRYFGQLTLSNGKPFADVRDRFRFSLPWTFDDDVQDGEPRRLLIAGANKRQLTILLTRNKIPSETTIVMSLPTAEYLERAFPAALECEELKSLKPRLEALTKDIRQGIGRLGQYKGTNLIPDRVFAAGESGDTVETPVRDTKCWLVMLESGKSLQLGRHSSVFRFEPGARKSIEQSFARVSAVDLEDGDGILTNSVGLRVALDDTLRAHGIAGLEAIRDEDKVAYYKQVLNQILEEKYPRKSTAERSRLILAEMKLHAGSSSDLPMSIEYWISNLTQQPEAGRFEPPRSAHSVAHFNLFAQVLGFDERETRRNWRAIQQLRVGHQQAGKQMSSMWQDLILDSTEFLVDKGIPRAELDHLLQLVVESVETIAAIHPPEAS